MGDPLSPSDRKAFEACARREQPSGDRWDAAWFASVGLSAIASLQSALAVERERAEKAGDDWELIWAKEKCRADDAEADAARLREAMSKSQRWLRGLAGYAPPEICKDDFAYDRLLANVHKAAKDALAEIDQALSTPAPATKKGHAGDCTIYAAKGNGEPTDGICICGHGLRHLRKDGSEEHLYAKWRLDDPAQADSACQRCDQCGCEWARLDNETWGCPLCFCRAELSRLRKQIAAEHDPPLRHRVENAEAEVDRLRAQLATHRHAALNNYWVWQGDDDDHLESLVCPVMIPPDVLLKMLGENDRLRERVGELEGIIVRAREEARELHQSGAKDAARHLPQIIYILDGARDPHPSPLEALDKAREAGAHAWDQVDDPEAFLGRKAAEAERQMFGAFALARNVVAENARLRERVGECAWSEDSEGVWNAACGEMFTFNDGGPYDNRVKFCPYCGKKLAQQREAQREGGGEDG